MVSAPPAPLPATAAAAITCVPLAQLDVKQMQALCVPTPSPSASPARRPATLSLDAPCCPRTLHASLLEHQISELEEDDNDNLLTVSSITARPLIAKSHELRSSRKQQQQAQHQQQLASSGTARGKCQRRRRAKELERPAALQSSSRRNHRQLAKDRDSSTSTTESGGAGAEPPDGGYGWFIVFGAFSVQFWVAGLVKSYGVLYVEIMETFPSSTATVASWIPAILSALCLVLAPLSSALCQRFSCRAVVFVGGIFCALGMILSYFATNLLHLLFTFGILTGESARGDLSDLYLSLPLTLVQALAAVCRPRRASSSSPSTSTSIVPWPTGSACRAQRQAASCCPY